MNTITLKLPKTLDAKLAAAAKKQGESKSAIVRAALREYFERNGASSRASFAELARDFIGCVEGGPPDLSYNNRYMEGFGK
jgi:Arc/MetJ-type ribon-helix-helix transcriptional regulator